MPQSPYAKVSSIKSTFKLTVTIDDTVVYSVRMLSNVKT